MTQENNLFKNGKRINYGGLRKGARTTDCHIFIHNSLMEDITELQVNYEYYADKRIMKSRIVNMALMMLSDALSEKDDKDKIKFIQGMDIEYKKRFY